jgi:hypothetical protein
MAPSPNTINNAFPQYLFAPLHTQRQRRERESEAQKVTKYLLWQLIGKKLTQTPQSLTPAKGKCHHVVVVDLEL